MKILTSKKSVLIIFSLTSLLMLPSTSAFFSDDSVFGSLKESIKKAQTFLVDEMVPLISEGLRAVQKVEDFVDATIGEDCAFECKGSKVPAPRPGHVPTSNGCGSLDVFFDDSEESLIHVEQEFTGCCNAHDVCYDTCGADKDDCDLAFKRCLYGICKAKKKSGILDSKACKLKAKVFYLTVIGVGCRSYLDAQKDACICVSDNTYNNNNNRFKNEL